MNQNMKDMTDQFRLDSEELEALHMNLDGAMVPKADANNKVYSAWGRVCKFAEMASHPSNAAVQDGPKWRTAGGIPRYKDKPAATVQPVMQVPTKKIKDVEIRYLAERFGLHSFFNSKAVTEGFFSFSRELLKRADPAAIDVRDALKWTSGVLQELIKGKWRDAKEQDRVRIGNTVKTISEVLDMADAALSPPQTGKEQA